MKFPIFGLERVQSIYENTVEYNLTESGFHPLTLGELLTPKQLETTRTTGLGYGQTNGSPAVRERIAALYSEAGGMAFMRYDFEINSAKLADWLRTEHSTFILAGDCFGMDSFFRIGIGSKTDYLKPKLSGSAG